MSTITIQSQFTNAEYRALELIARKNDTQVHHLIEALVRRSLTPSSGRVLHVRTEAPPKRLPAERQKRRAHLVEADVRAILARRLSGEPLKTIAADFDVDISTVCNIARGKTWTHITRETPTEGATA